MISRAVCHDCDAEHVRCDLCQAHACLHVVELFTEGIQPDGWPGPMLRVGPRGRLRVGTTDYVVTFLTARLTPVSSLDQPVILSAN